MQLSDKAQASINKVIAKFQSGDLSPIRAVVRIQLDPKAPARFWSLSNKILAFIQAEELDCRGFHQWQEVGRQVKRGSQAVYIIRPHTIKVAPEADDKKEERIVCTGFSTIPVFAASDTDGDQALPTYQPAQLPPLVDIAHEFGIAVAYVPVVPDRLGDSRTDGSKIRLGTHDPRVFFHELTHAIQAKLEGGLKGGQHLDQETIAEFTSTVLMEVYGFPDTSGDAWRYISRYAEDPLLAISQAMGTIERVLAVLLPHS